jgi:hypothetical protein
MLKNELALNNQGSNHSTGIIARGKLITERIFEQKHTGVDPKTFSVWKKLGLLGFLQKEKKAHLSFVDLVWVRLLDTLREFGCSTTLMAKMFEAYYTKAFTENLSIKKMKAHYNYFTDQKKIRPLTVDEAYQLNILKDFIENPLISSIIRTDVSYFSDLVMDSLIFGPDAGIVIYSDKSFTDYSNNPIKRTLNKTVLLDTSKPHIKIPISHLFIDFLSEKDKEELLVPSGFLSEEELIVIKEIRKKNLKSITIMFDEKNNNVKKIESTTSGILSPDKSKEIMKALGLQNYMKIELNTRDGNRLAYTRNENKYL